MDLRRNSKEKDTMFEIVSYILSKFAIVKCKNEYSKYLQKIFAAGTGNAFEVHFVAFRNACERGHIQRYKYHVATYLGYVAPRNKNVLARFEKFLYSGDDNAQHVFAVAIYYHIYYLAQTSAVLKVYDLFRP